MVGDTYNRYYDLWGDLPHGSCARLKFHTVAQTKVVSNIGRPTNWNALLKSKTGKWACYSMVIYSSGLESKGMST